MFFYSDTKSGEPFDPLLVARCDPNKQYLKHYSNMLILQVMINEGSRVEKQQASKEMGICERKMNYWKRHERFDMKLVTEGCDKLKKEWKGRV